MAASVESKKLPEPFLRRAAAFECTPRELVQRIYRIQLHKGNRTSNFDHPFFLLKTTSLDDRIEFIKSFRNKFTALCMGRIMAKDDEIYGEGGPTTSYFTFDISGNWYHPPISSKRKS